MFIINNLFQAIANLLHLAITIYIYIIIARVVISWLQPNPYSGWVRFIHNATEPVLSRVRSVLPVIAGLDLSPIVVIFVLMFIDQFLVATLRQIATF